MIFLKMKAYVKVLPGKPSGKNDATKFVLFYTPRTLHTVQACVLWTQQVYNHKTCSYERFMREYCMKLATMEDAERSKYTSISIIMLSIMIKLWHFLLIMASLAKFWPSETWGSGDSLPCEHIQLNTLILCWRMVSFKVQVELVPHPG